MRISDIMRLGKSAIIFATIVVAFLAIIWLLGDNQSSLGFANLF